MDAALEPIPGIYFKRAARFIPQSLSLFSIWTTSTPCYEVHDNLMATSSTLCAFPM